MAASWLGRIVFSKRDDLPEMGNKQRIIGNGQQIFPTTFDCTQT